MAVSPKSSVRVSGNHSRLNRGKLQNSILLGLPAKECDAVLKNLEFIELPTPSVLHEAGEPIKFAYLLKAGLLPSLL